jgi:hypothetical protein
MRFFRTLFTCFLIPYFLCFLKADQLVKRVDSLHAEKRAIKMELESIRSTQPENVKCWQRFSSANEALCLSNLSQLYSHTGASPKKVSPFRNHSCALLYLWEFNLIAHEPAAEVFNTSSTLCVNVWVRCRVVIWTIVIRTNCKMNL